MAKLFDELERGAWGGLVLTHARLFQQIEEDLRRRCGITHPEFEVLLRLFLAPEGRMRLQELAARSLLSPSGNSRAVGRLVSAGFVTREEAPEDRRGAYAALTEAGRQQFLVAAEGHVALVRRELLDKLDDDDKRALAAIWRKVGG